MSAISSEVSAVARRLPVAMETLCGMLRDFERVVDPSQRRLGLILNSMLADSKNSSLLSLIARFTCERRVWNLTFSDSDGCNFSFLRTVSFFLIRLITAPVSRGTGFRPLNRLVAILSSTAGRNRSFQVCQQFSRSPSTTTLVRSTERRASQPLSPFFNIPLLISPTLIQRTS